MKHIYSVCHIKNVFTLHEKNQTYRFFFLDSVQLLKPLNKRELNTT
jgi:hypothetical protein